MNSLWGRYNTITKPSGLELDSGSFEQSPNCVRVPVIDIRVQVKSSKIRTRVLHHCLWCIRPYMMWSGKTWNKERRKTNSISFFFKNQFADPLSTKPSSQCIPCRSVFVTDFWIDDSSVTLKLFNYKAIVSWWVCPCSSRFKEIPCIKLGYLGQN